MPWYWILIWVMLAVAIGFGPIFAFLVAPILVKRQHVANANPLWKALDPALLSAEMREFLESTAGQFQALGFEHRGSFGFESSPQVPTALTLFVHPATSDAAVVSISASNASRVMEILISSSFADGWRVVTAYNTSPPVVPADPRFDSLMISWVRDVPTLWEAHRRRLERLGVVSRQRVAPAPGTELESMRRDLDDEMRRQVRLGHTYLDGASSAYRLTWKGAYL